MIHAILGWDAGPREQPLCGADVSFLYKTDGHEHTTCAACRAHPLFRADRSAAPWPFPETVAESTAMLIKRREWQESQRHAL